MPTTRRKKRTRPSRTFTFKAYLDEDSDLITWLESLSSGQRSETVRDILRSHKTESDLVALLTAQHRETQRKLDELAARLAQGVSVTQETQAQMDDTATQRRKKNLLDTEW
jgi:hypothetical protein